MLAKVEVPYRVIDVAAGDLGASAARKFDCEGWVPTQGRYRELTSTSNCTQVQSRRLRVRMRDTDGVRPLATLNGTLATTTRRATPRSPSRPASTPATADRYPGTSGRTQGKAIETSPARS